jgi:23S rRNA (uracil1939-C5)-methyltransferase
VLSIGVQGDGQVEHPSGRLYVPLTVPGDRVRARIVGTRGDGFAAEVIELLEPGPDRAQPPCPHFGRCGGCAFQHVADRAYVDWKLGRLETALARAGWRDVACAPLARTPPGARRRATFAAVRPRRKPGSPGEGVAIAGFHARRSHDIVDLGVCPVLDPRIVALLPPLRQTLSQVLHPGERTQVTVIAADAGLDVVMDWPEHLPFALREHLTKLALEADLARLSWHRNGTETTEPLVVRRPVRTRFGTVPVDLPPGCFLQASRAGEEAIVAAVREGLGGSRTVADLFCGVGSIALPIAAGGTRVHAVDVDGEAIGALGHAGRSLAGVSTEVRDLFARPLWPEELRLFEGVVFDPPRAGAEAQARQLSQSSVPVIAAVSCNPESFARDARILAQGGYHLERVTPIDQFLWSPHLEFVAIFRR